MKDIKGEITYNGKTYPYVFNLNVMEAIQDEYGTLDKWGELTDGSSGEVNAKALIFGFTAMFNEGIDIQNEEKGTNEPPVTLKQVGRMVWAVGLENAAQKMNDLIVDSTKSDEKNA